ncbi:MAG TPA: CPBP family intramembrane glutamic endopeptidase [Blastocatellia bacterium]|nr:CPBP family intramembrane glutamic endopeptidase [Blastocatellia bacterium]
MDSIAPELTAPARRRSSSQAALKAVGFAFTLYVVWIGAWLFDFQLERHIAWINTDAGQAIYWLIMKLVVWVLPALVLIRMIGGNLADVIGLKSGRSIILWGGGVGLVLGGIAVATKVVSHNAVPLIHFGWPFFGGVLISPITEEITFRGAILEALKQRYSFTVANLITAILFLGSHMPGWYFQGRLTFMLKNPFGGALTILWLGLVFGYVAYRSKSVAASTLTHFLNNFFSI